MPMTFLSAAERAGGSGGTAVPFTRSADVAQLGMMMALDQTDSTRLARYAESWRFYFGRHWGFAREDGEPTVTLNYYRKIVDKLAEFLSIGGFVITTPAALEETSKPYLDEVWKLNNRDQLSLEIATMGGVTGDVFLMVTDVEPTELDRRINPYSQGRTRIQLLGSEQVFPTWDPLDTTRMLQCRIEYVFRPSKDVRTRGAEFDEKGQPLAFKRFTQIITPGQIMEQYHGEIPTIRQNILGEIPIVHIKNISVPKEVYGLSDGQDLIDLNRELNEKSTDISDIINYHSAPITVITGAKTKNLERGPRQIWSGLPANANVFNLKLDGDLTASQNYWDRIKRTLHEVSDVPEGVLGERQAISNTSGVAMHLQFQPILMRTKRKRDTYEPGLQRVNYFILRIGMVKGRVKLPYDLCANCGGKILEYDDPNGDTEWVWNDEADDYIQKVKRVRRCFHINKQTLDFMDPSQMRVKVWRQYGFGNEMKDMTIAEAKDVAREDSARSYWDYSYVDEDEMREWQQRVNDVRARNEQRADGTEAEPEPLPPKRKVKPLPPGEAVTYEEPVTVNARIPLYHPKTGELRRVVEKRLQLVPTGCQNPVYQNPYETWVSYNDVLPKDEALQATLYGLYQERGWVDEEWCQARIPDIAQDMTSINRRLRTTRPLRLNQNRGTNPDIDTVVDNLTKIPGPNGDPINLDEQI